MTHHFTADTLVGEVAAMYPVTMRMLEALGIDYCCGGKVPLHQAATERGMPVETVISVLEAAITQVAAEGGLARQWADAPLEGLLHHILETHHVYTHSELPRIETMLGMVVRAHGANHADVLLPLAQTYLALKAELMPHLEKEERVTFPAILRMQEGEADTVRQTLQELEAEHEHAGAALATMRTVTNDYEVPADACNTYRALYDALKAIERDLHQHVHLENNIVFPRVKAMLAAG